MIAVGVGFKLYLTSGSLDAVLVVIKLFEPRNEKLPDTAVTYLVHIVFFAVPVVEVTYYTNINGFRSPDSENYTAYTVLFGKMRTEKFVRFGIFSLMEKIKRNFIFLRHVNSHNRYS